MGGHKCQAVPKRTRAKMIRIWVVGYFKDHTSSCQGTTHLPKAQNYSGSLDNFWVSKFGFQVHFLGSPSPHFSLGAASTPRPRPSAELRAAGSEAFHDAIDESYFEELDRRAPTAIITCALIDWSILFTFSWVTDKRCFS